MPIQPWLLETQLKIKWFIVILNDISWDIQRDDFCIWTGSICMYWYFNDTLWDGSHSSIDYHKWSVCSTSSFNIHTLRVSLKFSVLPKDTLALKLRRQKRLQWATNTLIHSGCTTYSSQRQCSSISWVKFLVVWKCLTSIKCLMCRAH